MQTLLELPSEKATLETGISPGLLPVDGLFWHDGENIYFANGGPRSMSGSSLSATLSAAPQALAQALVAAAERVYIGLPTALVYTVGATVTSIGTGFSASGVWSLETFGTWLVATNGVDLPKLWKNGTLGTLAVNASTVRIVRKLGPHLLALGLDSELDKLAWCSADNPDDWSIISPTNTAGDQTLRDLGGDIVAATELGQDLAVYGKDAMGVVSYIGTPFIFGFRRLLNSIGAVGPNAVCSTGNLNYGLARSGAWRTDGNQYNFIDEPAMQEYLQENINWDMAHLVVCFHDESTKQILWSYPELGSLVNNKAVGFRYTNGTWTRYSQGFSAAIPRDVLGAPVIARDLTLRLWGTESASDAEAWVQSKPLDFGSDEVWKRVQGLKLGLKGAATLSLGEQNAFGEGDTTSVYHIAAAAAWPNIPDREVLGWTIKLSGTAWSLSGIKVRGAPVGASI